ncbi:hypothetical protein HC752_23875 [Vibrio sp. S9_S30]|uniref:hypothetical protein n=1 Tax=Vibrio sp. S9_S30 TaxID=2720226 RepID=UPI001681B298|nr:hypothetical protein [Vibrio sp. S9_S30]MBD1559962.1 hypothetical protein [Vibrio sp. S9_S30]
MNPQQVDSKRSLILGNFDALPCRPTEITAKQMAARKNHLAKLLKQPICLLMKSKRHFTKGTLPIFNWEKFKS